MKANYVLIDYENMQPAALAALGQQHFKVIVFVGANQSKVSFDIVAALNGMEHKAEYIKISGNGPNALDFHIAFYIGHLAAANPEARFHIVSGDAGFDPLIAHLKGKGIRVSRCQQVTEIPTVKNVASTTGVSPSSSASPAKVPVDKVGLILVRLKGMGSALPGTVKTLSRTINALFKKELAAGEVASLVKRLQGQGIITISGTKVAYKLPA